MTNSAVTMGQITCTHACRQLKKHSKVKICSQARIMMTEMGTVHSILSQPQHFLPSWPLILAKKEQLQGWFGANDTCKWLQTAAEVLQSQNWFMIKVYKAWDGNRTWIFIPNTPFSANPAPKFGQKWTVWGLLWPKSHVWMTINCCRRLSKSKLVHNQGL